MDHISDHACSDLNFQNMVSLMVMDLVKLWV